MFERIELLGRYQALPYIMRFNKYEESPYRGIYITVARWINQPAFFKKKSLYDFIHITDYKDGDYASKRYFDQLNADYPDIIDKYFYKKYWCETVGGDNQ
jgi:hypothetical protein